MGAWGCCVVCALRWLCVCVCVLWFVCACGVSVGCVLSPLLFSRLVSLLKCLFLFFSSLFSFLFSPLSFLSSSLSLHTQRRDQTDKWLYQLRTVMHHAIHWIKRELSICQSLLCHNLGSSRVLSQIKPQAPLLVVPIRPCLIFMFNVLSALPGFRPRLSREILWIAKSMTANCSGRMSNSTHVAYLFDGAYSQHMQHSLFTFVLARWKHPWQMISQ